ncbi:MAG: beta-lactamase family protein [Solirubrobacteraceae bacterium]|nr:beta-lactamase family protein [Solirubrobacteraceae bacterium]
MFRRTAVTTAVAATAAVFALSAPFAGAQAPGGPGASGPGSITTTPPPPPDPHPDPTGPDVAALPTPPAPPAPGPQTVVSEPVVEPAAFAAAIEQRLAGPGAPVGYAYAITRNGQLVASNGVGDARIAADGQQDFTPTSRIEVMSVTKPMGAIALQQILAKRGISIDTPISAYLPKLWAKGPGYAANSANPVTFRHLLTHTSGIRQLLDNPPPGVTFSNTWEGMKDIAQIGTTPGGVSSYKNANYVMIRVLIGRLAGIANTGTGPLAIVGEKSHASRYLTYLNTHVFAKAGVPKVTCWSDDDANAPMVYDRDNLAIGGRVIEREGEDRKHCGGHTGLHLSAIDLVKVATHLRHTEQLLTVPARELMFAGRLGWNAGSNQGTAMGEWWHGGDGYFGGNRDVHTCVATLRQNYEVAIVINSQHQTGSGQCSTLRAAYDDAA